VRKDYKTDMLREHLMEFEESQRDTRQLARLFSYRRRGIGFTDHLMPGMTGVELAHAVQAILPEARALIISGFAEVECLDTSLNRLAKPFVQSDLATALAGVRRP
jgi:YesN/AraC family two-component response regulator